MSSEDHYLNYVPQDANKKLLTEITLSFMRLLHHSLQNIEHYTYAYNYFLILHSLFCVPMQFAKRIVLYNDMFVIRQCDAASGFQQLCVTGWRISVYFACEPC